jgi:hypothetical protein
MAAGPVYTTTARTVHITPLPTAIPLWRVVQSLPINGCFSDSTFLALSKYVTVFFLLKLNLSATYKLSVCLVD